MAETAIASSSSCVAETEAAMEEGSEELTLMVRWNGKVFIVRVFWDDPVSELKRRICELTNVLPKRQKLLYPKLGNKLANDSVLLSQLPLKPTVSMTMIGTVEEDIIVDQEDDPEIIDDFELKKNETVNIKDMDVNKQRLCRRIAQYKIGIRNPCRKGKKLLVLDIDYTIFDHRSTAETPAELMRPFLHEFLTTAYLEYDIMIWSATSMMWVELKMGQLGLLNNGNYKITALLDHLAMISVRSDSCPAFDCKPLALIWALFPEFYSSKNTIMLDDLRKNFVMNPQNGLSIRPFKKAHLNRDSDEELVKLGRYLADIAGLEDLSGLHHKYWEFYPFKRN